MNHSVNTWENEMKQHYTPADASKDYDDMRFGSNIDAEDEEELLRSFMRNSSTMGLPIVDSGSLLRIARAVERLVELALDARDEAAESPSDGPLHWHREYLLHLKPAADKVHADVQREWKRIAKFADIDLLEKRANTKRCYQFITRNHSFGSCTSPEAYDSRSDSLYEMRDTLRTLKKVRNPKHLTLLPNVGKVFAEKATK
jgi:hypothetical protein